DVDRDIGILLFKLCEDLGENVETGPFIGAHNDFSARDAFGFSNGREDGLTGIESVFDILQKNLAGCGERNLSPRTIEQSGANFFFEGANLRGNSRLGAKALLGGARERTQASDFLESFELVKVHRLAQPADES